MATHDQDHYTVLVRFEGDSLEALRRMAQQQQQPYDAVIRDAVLRVNELNSLFDLHKENTMRGRQTKVEHL